MDQHYFLVCPVNSQNEEKLAGKGEARLCLLTNATYPRWTCISPFGVRLSKAYTVVPNMQSTIIVRLHEEAKSQAQQYEYYYYQNRMVERLYSYFFISDKVHVYSGEGRKTAARHVMMISINHARIYLGLRVSPFVCSRSSSLKEICSRGNNKVLYISLYRDKCLLFMLKLY